MCGTLLLLAVVSFSIHYPEIAAAQTTSPQTDRIGTARALYEQGLAFMERRELEQAADSFRKALQHDPEFAEAYAALGRTYFKMREWQKAVDNLNRAAVLKGKRRDTRDVAVASDAPVKVSNRPSLPRVNTEIITSNEIIASTIKLRSLLPQPPEPPSEPSPLPVKETAAAEVLPIAITEETPLTKIYRVGANDVLDVRLNDGSEQPSTLYTVTAAGLLEHPLLNEPMTVAGLTVEEIATRIEADLQKRAIIETAKALVGVREYASHSVLVSGLVKESGTKFLRREAIPLYVVVANAQPLPEAANVTVVRGGDGNQIYEIELTEAVDTNFVVRSGDVITLRPNTTQFIYIAGEIKFPGEKTFRRGLTLMQVVVASGGLGPKAKIAEIARDNEGGFLVSTRFKVKDILAGKAVDPLLKPGDRISILR